MEFKHYFLAYFIWLLFNRTIIFANLKIRWKSFIVKWENKIKALFVIRYISTICASCWCFWVNLPASVYFGDIFDLFAFFCLTFFVESVYSGFNQLVKNSKYE